VIFFMAVSSSQEARSSDRASWSRHFNFNRNRDRASRVRDVDLARETAMLSSAQILVQAGVSVLSQANQAPQVALKLLS
jgi:flagellin-like hook-associated protein FlgL